MILPEDTKEAIPSDDEDDYYTPPSPLGPYRALADSFEPYHDDPNAVGLTDYSYPLSPHSPAATSLTHPFLLSYGPDADENDIELGPAPPYTPLDNRFGISLSRSDKRIASVLRRARARLAYAALAALILYIVILVATLASMRMFGHRRHGPPHGPFGGSNGGVGEGDRQDDNKPMPGDQWRPDGSAAQCASYSSSDWLSFPAREDQPSLPTPLAPGSGMRRSTNTTFLVPTYWTGELFAHLVGPAGVGNIFVSTFDGDSDTVFDEDTAENTAIIGLDRDGHPPNRGEYVRMIIEAVYDVLPGVAQDTPATAENSPGWEMLEASRVCLMIRTLNGTESGPHSQHKPRQYQRRQSGRGEMSEGEHDPPHDVRNPPSQGGQEGDNKMQRSGTGVGIYTAQPSKTSHSDWPGTPLQFRLHIFVPSSVRDVVSSPPRSLASSLINALSGSDPHPRGPIGLVHALGIRGGVSDVFVDDLKGALIGALDIQSTVGSITLDGVRAEVIKLETVGEVRAEVAISHELEVKTPAGKVDLNVTLARPPEFSIFHHGQHNETSGLPTVVNACELPPISINVQANNDKATVRHGDWEAPCRGLHQFIRNMVGTTEVHPHALFEGPYYLSTSVGDISVDLTGADKLDPLGLGRWRNITMEQHDRLGSKYISGEVHWEKKEAEVQSREESVLTGSVYSEEERSPPSHRLKKKELGMIVETSVGKIDIVF